MRRRVGAEEGKEERGYIPSLRFEVVEGVRVRPKAELGAGQLLLVANNLLLIL